MNFGLLTFLCRQMINLSIHIWHDSKMNPFICRTRISCVMLALFVLRHSKISNAFSPLCIFLAKIHVSVPFSWPFFGRTLFFGKVDPHPPHRNANNIEPYTFVTLFPENLRHPHPHLHYVTLEWPHTATFLCPCKANSPPSHQNRCHLRMSL